MTRLVSSIGLAITLMCTPNLAHAELVTAPGNIPGPQLVVDFSQFTESFPPSGSPVQVGGLVGKDVTMVGSADYGNISYSLGYMFWNPQNGYWRGPLYTTPGLYFTTVNPDKLTEVMTFHFHDGPVRAVGAFQL